MDDAINDKAKEMQCLDWVDSEPFVIEGNRASGSFVSLDFEYYPCNIIASGDLQKEKVGDECIADKQKQLDYVGDVNFVFLSNQERFNPL